MYGVPKNMGNTEKQRRGAYKLDFERIKRLSDGIKRVKAVMLGDLCLDVYWSADMTKSSLSRETAHFPLPVVNERFSPGAGANVANCMAALSPASVKVLGVIGDDWRGDVLRKLLKENGTICSDGVITVKGRLTNAYCKPMRFGYSGVETEDPRIDFENYSPLPKDAEEELLSVLDGAVSGAGVLTVSDQMACGCITPRVRERITKYASDGLRVLVDSRDRIGLYGGVLLKPNERECALALGMRGDALGGGASDEDIVGAAKALSARCRSDVCLTLGDRGSLFVGGDDTIFTPAVTCVGETDTVGAGDAFLSALSLAFAAGADAASACALASLAAGVTVRKIGVTGTADASEIISLSEGSDVRD